jgi:hypothetical protein
VEEAEATRLKKDADLKAKMDEEAAKAIHLEVTENMNFSVTPKSSTVSASTSSSDRRSSSHLRTTTTTTTVNRTAEMEEAEEARKFLEESQKKKEKKGTPKTSPKEIAKKTTKKPAKLTPKPAKATTKARTKRKAPAKSAIPAAKKLRTRPSAPIINILITGTGHAVRDQVKKIPNAALIENTRNAKNATHVIVCSKTVPIRRTPKLLIALCSHSASHFLGYEWLDDSIAAAAAVPVSEFLVTHRKFKKVTDEFVRKFDVNIGDALATKSESAEPIFHNTAVTFDKGLAGNKFPPEAELKLIVEAGGGKFQKTPGKAGNLVVVTDDNAKVTKKMKDSYKKLAAKGGKVAVVGKSEWLSSITSQTRLV